MSLLSVRRAIRVAGVVAVAVARRPFSYQISDADCVVEQLIIILLYVWRPPYPLWSLYEKARKSFLRSINFTST